MNRPNHLLLLIAYLGFISLGLPDTVIGVAWPSVRDTFGLQQSAAAWIFFGTGFSYFLSSFLTGRLLAMAGIGLLLAASSTLVAGSAFGYGFSPYWPLFVMWAVFHGFGSGAIDAGLNHYVAHHFSARHMNWLHACFSIGAALGPFTMTMVLTSGHNWRTGYFIVAAVLGTLAVLFACTAKRWNDPGGETAETPTSRQTVTLAQALRNGTVWRHIALFFIYTGLEALVGQWAFTLLTESRGMSTAAAGSWVVSYWASIAVGRVLFGFIVERLGVDRLLRVGMLMAVGGTGLFAWNVSNVVSSAALIFTGLGLAPIFPCMMTRTPVRLGGGIAAHAIGFQVSAAMLGAAALPATCGLLAVNVGLEAIPLVALVAAALVFAIHETLLRGDRIQAQLQASTAHATERH